MLFSKNIRNLPLMKRSRISLKIFIERRKILKQVQYDDNITPSLL